MKLVRRLILFISLTVIILSLTGNTDLPKLPLVKEQAKNFFTGLAGENKQILVVKIDDTNAAHPQIGLESADVVYVEQVEGGLTRLAAIYTSKLPPLIGPIRSARISDIELLAQFGRVGFAYSGAQSKMRPVIAAANLENLSAERNPPSIYGKDPDRPGPVDMILKPDLLLERANANPKIRIETATASVFPFGDAPKGETNTAVAKVKWPSAKYELRWDSTNEKWLIYFNEKPNMAANGDHLYADTAIIQIVSIMPSIYGDKFGEITPFSKTTGSGKAVMLRDGFSYQISWQRNLETDVTTWMSQDGGVANFKPGRTWIFLTDKAPVLTP
ncbi:putative lipoprotein YerB [Actinomycetota bacterium]|nr:putative lipoprotein YerB [Actinomycetota bacterium]